MLSRRSVRVKAMQLLYTLNRDRDINRSEGKKMYVQNIEKSFELLLFNIFLLYEICKNAVDDFEKRRGKYIPSDLDKKFKPVLFTNPMVSSIGSNRKLNQLFNKHDFKSKVDFDILKNIYFEYAKEEGYQIFINNPITSESTTEVLLDLFRFIKKFDTYEEILEDNYPNWVDDESVVIGAMKKIIKTLPSKDAEFFMDHFPEDQTIKDFGEALLLKTIQEDKALEDLIEPKLVNWEKDRIAVIDLILLKMAISEFLYFESIPTKVTINEYVELSKDYSTPKSREFINGILDSLLNDLNEKQLIVKSGRGLLD
jgi:transcription antitermination protein NusB